MQLPWAMLVDGTLEMIEKDGHKFGEVRVLSVLQREYRCVRCGGKILFHARDGDTLGFTPQEVLFDPCSNKFSRQLAA